MSTTPTEPNETQPSTEPQGTETTTNEPKPGEQSPAQETDWKAEARKWEAQAKKNKDAAAKLAEIEEASKTEAQKQAEALEAAQAKVREYETREQIATWAKEVSEETEVPADLLRGSTKEELQAHAEQFKALIGQQPATTHRPVPGEGHAPVTPLNGDGIEAALKSALGIR